METLKRENPLRDATGFQRAIIDWFVDTGKNYPWRDTQDPYEILVSEIMLQQTQVATVLGKGYYSNWLERFPDVHVLAKAREDEILKAWEGLGYYRRARNLQKAAQAVISEFGGVFPGTAQEILALPGVGRYTAGAVATFAFNHSVPIVDANIARVLSRLFDYEEIIDKNPGQNQLWGWAEALVPEIDARIYNSGLMELGQRNCAPKNPECPTCPVRQFCTTKSPESLPKKTPKAKTVFLDEHVIYCVKEGMILLQQEQSNRRQGLWKLPEGDGTGPILTKFKYSITHHRVTLFVHEVERAPDLENADWFELEAIDDVAMPAPYRKALSRNNEGELL